MRRVLLSNTLNTRDLGGYRTNVGKTTRYNSFLRSDLPVSASNKDIELLLTKGIRTIVDLRSSEEVKRNPCAFKENESFQYYHCKIHGDGRLPESFEVVGDSYFEMVDEQKSILKVVKILANEEGGVLYHCTAGKDRTGVISALLLMLVGVSKEDVLADYEKSQENLSELLKGFCEENKHVDINIITPKREHMKRFLEMFYEKYTDAEAYFTTIGLSYSEIVRLKEKLIKV
ncbi:MAG: tyrosine-protein phosphatase [Clostridium sp.]